MKLEFCCLMTFSNGNQLSNRKFDTFPLDWSHLLTQLWNGREGFKLHLKKGRGWQRMLSLISKPTGCFSSLQVPTRVTAETFRCGPLLTSALLSLVCWPFCLINNCSHPFWSGFLINPEVLLYFVENWSGPEQQPLGTELAPSSAQPSSSFISYCWHQSNEKKIILGSNWSVVIFPL